MTLDHLGVPGAMVRPSALPDAAREESVQDGAPAVHALRVQAAGEAFPTVAPTHWFSVFNTPAFFTFHATDRRGFYFTYCEVQTGNVVGRVHFTELTPGHFISPYRGTFGGFETSTSDISLIEKFVADTEQELARLGAHTVEVALKPFAHAPGTNAGLFNVLTRRGYATTVQDLSYVMPVTGGELTDKMRRNNQKRLRKCAREGFTFTQCNTPSAKREAYRAIAANRETHGYSLSMTYEQVEAMDELFPGHYHYFAVEHSGATVAGAICISVSSDVLYVFYWGDLPGYESFSPVVMLADGIYEYAQSGGFRLLDAGRSTDVSIPNMGLIRFKEGLGFEPSLKPTFLKHL